MESGDDGDYDIEIPFDRYLITPPRRAAHTTRKGRSEEETKKEQKEARKKAAPLTSVMFVEQTLSSMYAVKS